MRNVLRLYGDNAKEHGNYYVTIRVYSGVIVGNKAT